MGTQELERLLAEAIVDGAFPGAVYGVAVGDKTYRGAIGRYTYCDESPETAIDTIWDMASVSKVMGTTTMAMLLVEAGKLDIEAPVASVLPDFAQNNKGSITFRNLMVHDSGLIAFRPYQRTTSDPEQVVKTIMAEALTYETGTKMIYSDLNMITMARAMETITGQTMDHFLHEKVFAPLGMKRTGYIRTAGSVQDPSPLDPSQCAPTETVEMWRLQQRAERAEYLRKSPSQHLRRRGVVFPEQEHYIQGEVHDPTAMTLGGVAGHAGLFSTADDILTFVRALEGGKIVKKETVRWFTKKQSDLSSRALGWDTPSRGSSSGQFFGPLSYGHTGYTGTSLWVDPERMLAVTLLTNRVHPTSDNAKLGRFRPKFHDEVVRVLVNQ